MTDRAGVDSLAIISGQRHYDRQDVFYHILLLEERTVLGTTPQNRHCLLPMCNSWLEKLGHLILYSTQGIINGLCVGMELVGHLLVGKSVNVQSEHPVFEVTEGFLDMLVGVLKVLLIDEQGFRIINSIARQDLHQGSVPFGVINRLVERRVRIQWDMLLTGGSFDCADDVASDAKLCEGPEG